MVEPNGSGVHADGHVKKPMFGGWQLGNLAARTCSEMVRFTLRCRDS